MKNYIITIDVGTTNTRAYLWDFEGKTVKNQVYHSIGVKNTSIKGSNEELIKSLSNCLKELILAENISWRQVKYIIGSGMITSELGLKQVPHLTAPAQLKSFVLGLEKVEIPEVAPMPIWLVPGLKNSNAPVSLNNISEIDIMRGEETEVLGLLSLQEVGEDCILVLPGSHTKLIRVDACGSILGCVTSLTGELLQLLTEQSILAEALEECYPDSLDLDYLMEGYLTAQKNGLGHGAFAVRVLKLFGKNTKEQRASFLLGAVLQNDIMALLGSPILSYDKSVKIVISGKEPFCSGFYSLIKNMTETEKVEIVQEERPLSGLGCLLIAYYKSEN